MIHFDSSFALDKIKILSNEKGITDILFYDPIPDTDSPQNTVQAKNCRDQLVEYFSGVRKEFSLSLLPTGTSFQLRVWHALAQIPYGITKTYLEVALMLGSRTLSRAVGQACNKNPIPIIIPCHRVVGSNGDLTGYRGGVDKKAWLLEFEKQHADCKAE